LAMRLKAVTVDVQETLILENTVPDGVLAYLRFRVLEREQPVSDPARQVHVQDQDRCCLVSKNDLGTRELSESRSRMDSSTVRFAKNTVLDSVFLRYQICVPDGVLEHPRSTDG
jgi:hypothetical protein